MIKRQTPFVLVLPYVFEFLLFVSTSGPN